MKDLSRLLCRIGIHKWGEWRKIETPLVPIGGYDALEGTDNLAVTINTRCCDKCCRGQVKKVLSW